MVGGQAVTDCIAIGVGCRAGASAEAVEALIRRALRHAPRARRLGVFTIQDKAAEPGLNEAAGRFGLAVVSLAREVLRAQDVQTRSVRVETLFGVGSVAEAAALAGAGARAVLLVPRIAGGGVTCAIARSCGDPA